MVIYEATNTGPPVKKPQRKKIQGYKISGKCIYYDKVQPQILIKMNLIQHRGWQFCLEIT